MQRQRNENGKKKKKNLFKEEESWSVDFQTYSTAATKKIVQHWGKGHINE